MFEQIEEPSLNDTFANLALALLLVICAGVVIGLYLWVTQPDEVITINSLRNQGYSEIHLTGRRFTGCNGGDFSGEGFIALHPSGHSVTGVVCMGSGSTSIHID